MLRVVSGSARRANGRCVRFIASPSPVGGVAAAMALLARVAVRTKRLTSSSGSSPAQAEILVVVVPLPLAFPNLAERHCNFLGATATVERCQQEKYQLLVRRWSEPVTLATPTHRSLT